MSSLNAKVIPAGDELREWPVRNLQGVMVAVGWVYILTNEAMPSLIKVGFSLKDPSIRAGELNGTSVPHPFVVIYDALVDEPRAVEQEVHHYLRPWHESKEFFRVEEGLAIEAVKHIISFQNKMILHERLNFEFKPNNASTNKVNPFLDANGKPKPNYERSAKEWERRNK